MNPWELAESALRQRMAGFTAVPVHYQNVTPDSQPNAPFVFFEILWGEAFQASIGSPGANTYRHPGVAMAHIFVKTNTGTKTVTEHAGTIAALFRTQHFGGVRCETPSIGRPGPGDDDGNWYRVTVSIPFTFDATL